MICLLFFLILIDTINTVPLYEINTKYDPNIFYNIDLFEGDILTNLSNNLQYHAIPNEFDLWPNGKVYYDFDLSFPWPELVEQAMNYISKVTNNCITFRRKSELDYNYLNIIKGSGCYSEVGRKKGEQLLSLGEGCQVIGVAIHELLHALGFYHHHSRSDRDNYLEINWQNIHPQAVYNFHKLDDYENRLLTPFDYNSIMIYGRKAFSIDGHLETIIPIQPNTDIKDPGYKHEMTSLDVKALKILYKCKKTTSFPLHENEQEENDIDYQKNGFPQIDNFIPPYFEITPSILEQIEPSYFNLFTSTSNNDKKTKIDNQF